MEANQKLTSPLYLIPLSDEELVIIGRITVMWGHIDTQINSLLTFLFPPDKSKRLVNLPMGLKIKEIEEFANSLSEDAEKEVFVVLSSNIGSLIDERNTMSHGRWGLGFDGERNEYRWLAHSDKNPQQPFYADDLRSLHERVCSVAKLVDHVWYFYIINRPSPSETNRMHINSRHSDPDGPTPLDRTPYLR